MAAIGAEELRLTLEEFQEVARAQGLEGSSQDSLRRYHARLEGWAAGLVLLLGAGGCRALDDPEPSAPAEVSDYFLEEVFAGLDPETRAFLLKASFLPSVKPALADQMAGSTGAERILAHLHRHHCFTERRGHSPPEYRFHPLFREFLASRARSELTPEERRRTQRVAARLLVEDGQPVAAAELLQDARDEDGLTDLALAAAPELISQGRGAVVAAWIEALSEERVRGTPWLLHWAAASRMGTDPAAARQLYGQAFQRFRDDGPYGGEGSTGLLLSWAGALDAILSGLEDFAEADPWIERFYEVVGGPEAVPADAGGNRAVAVMYAALALRRPDHPDFAAWEARALGVARACKDPNLVIQILAHAAFSKTSRAHFAEAEMILDRMRHAVRLSDVTPLARIRTTFVEMFLDGAQGRWKKALGKMEEGLEEARTSGVHAMDAVLLTMGVRAALNAGDLLQARSLLDSCRAFLPTAGAWHRCLQHYLGGALALREGHLGRAEESTRAALGIVDSLGIPYGKAAVHLLRAEVAHARGEHTAAAEFLKEAVRGARAAGNAQLELNCGLVEARIRFDAREDALAVGVLREAMAFGAHRGDLVPYLYDPADLAALSARALQEGIEVEYVRDLVQRCGLVPESPPLGVESWPWPVRIYTLGRFELVRDNRPVRSRGKAQQKPLELLKALIAFGGRGVGLGSLADTLWPDADGDMAQQSLSTTLHRLRKLLAVDDLLTVREARLSLDARRCWVDVWAFERLVGQAEGLWKKETAPGGAERAARLTEQALELYKGRFLPHEVPEHWALPLRERLRSKFVRLVGILGREIERAGRWEDAVECYRRAVEVDPLVEDFYRRLMGAYGRLSRRAEALAVYRRCGKVLGTFLGLQPSPETEELRRELEGR